MSLFQTLKEKNIAARKANDTVAKTIYNVFLGEIGRAVDPSKPVEDAKVSSVAEKIISGIDVMLSSGGDQEVLAREKALLNEFIPPKADPADIEAFVGQYVQAIPDLSMKHMKQITTAVESHFQCAFDKSVVARAVQARLQK